MLDMQPNHPDSLVFSKAKTAIEDIQKLFKTLSIIDEKNKINHNIDKEKIKLCIENDGISVYYNEIIQYHITVDGSIYSVDTNRDMRLYQDLRIDNLIQD